MRFLHTADWQLGMTRHFLDKDAQSRFTAARTDAVRAIGRVAGEEGCAFVVVCGDVFESSFLHRQVLLRAFDAMASVPVPIYLLPGNHDPLGAGSIYRSPEFVAGCPAGVHVLEPGIHSPCSGVELVAAPWQTKHPLRDLVAEQCERLEPSTGCIRILAGHGIVDVMGPDPADPSLIELPRLEKALGEGIAHYVALGDRHSLTQVDGGGRVWYSGAPEVTDYDEVDPGKVLLVDIADDAEHSVEVTPRQVGTWRFVRETSHLNGAADVDELGRWLARLPDKERTVLKLSLVGGLGVGEKARLDRVLADAADLFAAVETWERHSDLVVLPNDVDLGDLDLTGFAATAFEELRTAAGSADAERAGTAQDALALLYRLMGCA